MNNIIKRRRALDSKNVPSEFLFFTKADDVAHYTETEKTDGCTYQVLWDATKGAYIQVTSSHSGWNRVDIQIDLPTTYYFDGDFELTFEAMWDNNVSSKMGGGLVGLINNEGIDGFTRISESNDGQGAALQNWWRLLFKGNQILTGQEYTQAQIPTGVIIPFKVQRISDTVRVYVNNNLLQTTTGVSGSWAVNAIQFMEQRYSTYTQALFYIKNLHVKSL